MTRILLIDDHQVVREGLKRLFAGERPGAVFGEAANASDALAAVASAEWDIAILDLSLPGPSGLDVLKALRVTAPALPVLIVSMHREEQYARRAFRAGAAGYVTKDCAREHLIAAFNKVLSGGRYVTPDMVERLIEDYQGGASRPPHQLLSDREFEVMRLIASGRTVGEIAALLALSDSTVATYRTRILDKLQLRTSAELMHYAIRNKLVD